VKVVASKKKKGRKPIVRTEQQKRDHSAAIKAGMAAKKEAQTKKAQIDEAA
jgi:hypothetical protein